MYNKIARFYRLSNKAYFALKSGGERSYRIQFLSELELRDGDRVLETSAGSGDNFPYIREQAGLFGLDISSGMLDYFEHGKDVPGIPGLIPENMLEIGYKEACKGMMYCITFRKP
ncbi:hypothetical protein [Paenibacillus sp. S150]|uniref:hypothetical protein n=1 Tax=Paenibacillus sp. S150 TaxID=2749826 RepID=UPI001C59DB4F|nr:hypothetical protein [Paenibacillus sp. S150]MBW4085444.1 hypothetical protein [Paenibacillus sp. S150]